MAVAVQTLKNKLFERTFRFRSTPPTLDRASPLQRRCALGLLLALAFTLGMSSTAGADDASSVTIAPFGPLTIYNPGADIDGVVLFVSGDGGWRLGVVDMAKAISGMHSLVIGIDVRQYLASLAAPHSGCHSLAEDFENLSHRVQRQLGVRDYHVPVLVGYSSGATIVYAALAQAPVGTFRGAISLGFCPDQDFRRASLCPGTDLKYSPTGNGNWLLEPASRLRDPWVALQGDLDAVCNAKVTAEFVSRTAGASLVSLPKVGHGFSITRNWLPEFETAYRQMIADSDRGAAAADVADLPLTEVTARTSSGRMALLLTGDGGWAGLDRELATRLAAAGVSVVGFNSLKYYWTARTPEQSARDVARVLDHYSAAWHAREFLLIGYSFGADVLPFVVNRLPAEMQRRITSVNLLGLSPNAVFEVRVADWLPGQAAEGRPVAAEIARMPAVPLLCLYGEGEKDTLCPDLPADRVTAAVLGRGHHFGGEYDRIAERVLEFAAPGTPR